MAPLPHCRWSRTSRTAWLPRSPSRPRQNRSPAMSDTPWTCVIAEDEAILREALVAQLRQAWPELQIVAECEDGASALEALSEHAPRVAFLDIRMPGLSGLEVATAAAEVTPH